MKAVGVDYIVYICCLYLFYFIDGYITTSHCNTCLNCQLMIFYHKYAYIHIYVYLYILYVYTYISTYTNIHIHAHTYKVLPAVYYSCNLVTSSYHKSHQQYEILLNYKKLEISCY